MTNKPPQAGEVAAMVERAVTVERFWRGEAQYGDVAEKIGDDVTAEYSRAAKIVADLVAEQSAMLTLLSAALQEKDGAREQYEELIFAVGMKHPGETRHETALRYIRQAETGGDNEARAALGDGQ